jgi:hypothetical protein
MAELKLTFDQAGNVRSDAMNFKGKACADASAKILAGMRGKSRDEKKKPEFFQQTTTGTSSVRG